MRWDEIKARCQFFALKVTVCESYISTRRIPLFRPTLAGQTLQLDPWYLAMPQDGFVVVTDSAIKGWTQTCTRTRTRPGPRPRTSTVPKVAGACGMNVQMGPACLASQPQLGLWLWTSHLTFLLQLPHLFPFTKCLQWYVKWYGWVQPSRIAAKTTQDWGPHNHWALGWHGKPAKAIQNAPQPYTQQNFPICHPASRTYNPFSLCDVLSFLCKPHLLNFRKTQKKLLPTDPQGFKMCWWPEAKYVLGSSSEQLLFRLFQTQF